MLIALVAGLILAAASSSTAAQLSDETLQIGGAQIEVRFEEGTFSVTPAAMRNWIAKSARAVTEYYGRFPVQHIRVVLVPLDRGRGVVFGRTFVPGPTPVIRVLVGAVASEDDLREDWVMTHEMVHLAFPSVPEKHHWIEEGIATYVEPIARVQIGDLTSAKVWRDMLDGMPHGLPGAGDRGLDNTHTWGRTYWGGAMFCLLADVEIHRRTHNRFGLQDALRAIMRSGTMLDDWPSLSRALKVGDDAVGIPVLMELYTKMKDAPYDPNLPALFQRLGVKLAGDSVTFDPNAPDASIVTSIMKPRAPKEP
ncbi:MAG TPA: hypothetical protein VKR29_07960 [Candidatus Binataceae bacterium]|nr:hypothetical protein [Candidatus Binataceae bacterium]